MSVENTNNLLSEKEDMRARESHEDFSDILKKRPAQRESQLKKSILRVFTVLDKYGKLNTSAIKSKTSLYSNTVNRVMKLAREKNLVKLETRLDKNHNEKIYSLKRNRAVVYINHITDYRENLRVREKQWKNLEYQAHLYEKFPENFLNWWTYYSPDTQKRKGMERPLRKIRALPIEEARKIFGFFKSGYFCKYCFEKNDAEWERPIITELQMKDANLAVCTLCKQECIVENEAVSDASTKGKEFKTQTQMDNISKKYKENQ